jgi:hypothetical protein
MAAIRRVQVTTQEEMESTITSYLARGFLIANRTPTSVTMQKTKEFNVLWAVIGFLLCILPLLIYLIYYATRPAVEIVEIYLAAA